MRYALNCHKYKIAGFYTGMNVQRELAGEQLQCWFDFETILTRTVLAKRIIVQILMLQMWMNDIGTSIPSVILGRH